MSPASPRQQHSTFFYTMMALLFSIIVGMGLRLLCGQTIISAFSEYVLQPVKTIYLNALKLVVSPVVFCSIAASIAGISDYKAYGRIGTKVVLLYLFTSVIAICIGILVATLLNPSAGVVVVAAEGYEVTATNVSLLDTLISIVPTNLITPFQEANMTQIIFLAILIGAASGILEQKNRICAFHRGLTLLHKLFLTIASLVLRFIPVGTFCAVTLLILDIDTMMVMSLVMLVGTVLCGAGIMLCFYGLLFFLATRQNPLRLLVKCLPNLVSFAMLCSTSAVLPQTLETCNEKLGIDPEISSFSIPLGSTINMDGACIYLTVSALFLAGLYDVTLTPDTMLQLGLTTLLLSVGAPPLPGAGFICLSVLVLQLGIPIDGIGYLLGIDQLMSMCRTVVNGFGDMVCTAVIAKGEGRMNMEVFNSR